MEPAGRRLARWALIAVVAAVYVSGAAAEEEGYKKAKKERILGVGLGVFLLSFFFFSMCGLCWIGTLLPEALLYMLENCSAEQFAEAFVGEHDTPGVIWNTRRAGAAERGSGRTEACAEGG